MSDNFTREGKKANRNHFNNNNTSSNNKNLKFNNEIISNDCDGIFAQLTDMFGDVIASDVILSVCNKSEWDLTACIENLIQESSEQASNTTLDESAKNINQIRNNCKITGNELLISNSKNNNNVVIGPTSELVEAQLKIPNDSVENTDVDIVIESEEQILDIAKSELINDTNNVNLGAIKKQLTQKTTPMENISNSSALKPFNFSSLLKQGDNHMFNLTNSQDTMMLQKTNKARNITKSPNYEKIVHLINQGIKIMIIMRGAPGSGKSYLAKQIIDETVKEPYRNHIFSSDNYFYDAQDRYCFNADKLSEAHTYNQKLVAKKCQKGWSPIIVDNTNIQLWEMYPYIDNAANFGYFIEILEPQTPWATSPRQLAKKNTHGVSLLSIERMLDNYEKINVYNLMRIRGLEFHLNISPQLRRYPIINPKIDNNEASNVPINNEPAIEMENQSNNSPSVVVMKQGNEISTISDKVPQLQMKREWNEDWVDHQFNDTPKAESDDVTNTPKPPRKMKYLNSDSLKEEAIKNVNSNVDDVIEISNQYNLIDWKVHNQEMQDFWSKANVPVSEDKNLTPAIELQQTSKSQRILQKKSSNAVALDKSDVLSMLGEINFHDKLKPETSLIDDLDLTICAPKLEMHQVGCENENKSFSQIREIYPTVPIEYLWDLFETCRGDGDWTMDILLKDESKLVDFTIQSKNRNTFKNFDCGCSKQMHIDLITFDDLPANSIDADLKSVQTTLKAAAPLQSSLSSPNLTNQKSTSSRKEKGVLSEEMRLAKRQIEEKIILGDEHYTKHMKKIRDIRRGVPPTTVTSNDINKPNAESDQQGASYNGTQSDVDVQSNDDTESSETDNEELVEVALGTELVSQLDNLFGINAYPKNTLNSMKTNVFMSKGLAKQLYALWMESMYNQIEEQKQKSLKEDEEFAKQLQSKEKYPKLFREPTNFKEIMDMEYAWAAYKAEIDEWKVTTPETLASRLTKEKLHHIFPDVEKDILEEVLSAHNNKFDETVNTLRDSLKCNINDEILAESNDLFEQARIEVEKPDDNYPITRSISDGSAKFSDVIKVNPVEAKRLILIDFEDYRNNAMHHDQLKSQCYAKAQSAIQSGETSVALYYSQIATLHKNKVDMNNQKAANCIMEVHSLTQNNPDIIDLHYLRVSEAVECLDIFLDKHINKLRMLPKNSKYLHIITGRGLHSARGISTVKLKVKNCLKERNLKCIEVNPGLLKVKIFLNSKLSQI